MENRVGENLSRAKSQDARATELDEVMSSPRETRSEVEPLRVTPIYLGDEPIKHHLVLMGIGTKSLVRSLPKGPGSEQLISTDSPSRFHDLSGPCENDPTVEGAPAGPFRN